MSERRPIIAVPVSNEADRLSDCLHALTHQHGDCNQTVLVLVNNSSDASDAVAHCFAATSPVPVLVENVELSPDDANAGGARRFVMQRAEELAGDNGVLLTTDADGRVALDWLQANLRAIDAGADAVAGRVAVDPIEEALIPRHLRLADADECAYANLLDTIEGHIDPDPADPLPRHDEHSGASMAVTVAAFRAAGGIPRMPVGEDRAFFNLLRRIDARIRHAPDVWVTVSGRIDGRAAGGMADTIRRRMSCPDAFLDDRLEPVADFVARIHLRRQLKERWVQTALARASVATLARDLQLAPSLIEQALTLPFFGAAWHVIETQSPALRRRRVAVSTVMQESLRAREILAKLDPAAEAVEPPLTMTA